MKFSQLLDTLESNYFITVLERNHSVIHLIDSTTDFNSIQLLVLLDSIVLHYDYDVLSNTLFVIVNI